MMGKVLTLPSRVYLPHLDLCKSLTFSSVSSLWGRVTALASQKVNLMLKSPVSLSHSSLASTSLLPHRAKQAGLSRNAH